MPGAFAHITAVNLAFTESYFDKLTLPLVAKNALRKYQNYLELGCVSPDLPYLKLADRVQNRWADKMHHQHVGDMIRALIRQVQHTRGEEQDKLFAWVSGYLSHVIADITIHPVIEKRVGHYAANKLQHRLCEMHQDAYIWQRMGLGEIGSRERISNSLGSCINGDDKQKLDRLITHHWEQALRDVFNLSYWHSEPEIDAWFRGFKKVVDLVEDQYRLFPFSRHVAALLGLTYPTVDQIDLSFIHQLHTPHGLASYDKVFNLAVANIQHYQQQLAAAVYADGRVDLFLNWNLDTGESPIGQLSAWVRDVSNNETKNPVGVELTASFDSTL
jgi:hypothetical protein